MSVIAQSHHTGANSTPQGYEYGMNDLFSKMYSHRFDCGKEVVDKSPTDILPQPY